jgi:hypothetical protein
MSIPVELSDLAEQSAKFPAAFLISVDPENAPRVNAVTPTVVGTDVHFDVGKRTSAYLVGNPKTTLLYPPPPGETFALLVDGTSDVIDQRVVFTPTWAVLHQTARTE